MISRGFTLVEVLVSLVVIAGLMAALTGVFSQAMSVSQLQTRVDKRVYEREQVFAFLEGRLRAVVLVGERNQPERPVMEVNSNRLRFVTQLHASSPYPGLNLMVVENSRTGPIVSVSTWPDAKEHTQVALPGGNIEFDVSGLGVVVPQVPLGISVTLDGVSKTLALGAQIPTDCILPLGDAAGTGGGLLCPGVTN